MATLTKFPIHTVHELADSTRSGLCPQLLSDIRDTQGLNLILNGSFDSNSDVSAWTYTPTDFSVIPVTGDYGIGYTDHCCNVPMGIYFNATTNSIYGDGSQATCSIVNAGLVIGNGSIVVITGTQNFDGVHTVTDYTPTTFRFSSTVSAYEIPPVTAVIRRKTWFGSLWKNTTNSANIPISLSTGKLYRLVVWYKPVSDLQNFLVSVVQFVGSTQTVVYQKAIQINEPTDYVSSWRKFEGEFEITSVAGVNSHAVRLQSDLEAYWDEVSIYDVAASLDEMGSELADRKAIDAISTTVSFVGTGSGVPILDHAVGSTGYYRPIISATPDSLDISQDANVVSLSGNFLRFDPGVLPHWMGLEFTDDDLNANGSVIVYHSLGCKIVHVAVGKAYANGEVLKMEPDFVKYLSNSFVEINMKGSVSTTATSNTYRAIIGLPGIGTMESGILTYPYSGSLSAIHEGDIYTSGSVREFMVEHDFNLTFTDAYGVSQDLDLLPVVVSDGYNQKIIPDYVNYLDNNRLTVGLTSFGKHWLANEIVDQNGHWNVAVGNIHSGVSGYFAEFTSGDLMSGGYTEALSAYTAGELVTGKLYVNHNLDQMLVPVTVVDDTFSRLSVNEYELRYINNNICEIDLRDYIGRAGGLRLMGKWGVLVGSVVNPVFGTGSVQGGKNQFYKRVTFGSTSADMTSGTPADCYGYKITTSSTATAGTVIGKVFVRCFDAIGEDGSLLSVGTLDEPERFVKQFLISENFEGQINWLEFGNHDDNGKMRGLIVNEYDYLDTATDIYLFRYANPYHAVMMQGEVGVSIFYDQVDWNPHYGFLFPGDGRTIIRYNPIESLAKDMASSLSDTRQATSCFKASSTDYYIYNAGGISSYDVDPSYPFYFPSLENATLSNKIDEYNTKVEVANAVYRASLTRGKYAMGVAYGDSTHLNIGYMYGGAIGETVGRSVSTDQIETYNQNTNTTALVGSGVSAKHMVAGVQTSSNAYFAGGIVFETADHQNIPELNMIDKYALASGTATDSTKVLTTKRYGCVGLNGMSGISYIVSGRYRTEVDKFTFSGETVSSGIKPVLDLASASATQDDTSIYMFGGFPYYDPGLETDVIQRMDMSNGTWSVVNGTLPAALSRTNGTNL